MKSADMRRCTCRRACCALQERAITPLGSNRVIHVDVSVICATNRNLREQVANGLFREDLYYRLNGLVVRLPALRERTDLDVVANKLLREGEANGGPRIKDSVMAMFRSYHWPGRYPPAWQPAAHRAPDRPRARRRSPRTTCTDDFLKTGWHARPPTPRTRRHAGSRCRAGRRARPGGSAPPQPTRLADVEVLAIVAAVKAHHGNISARGQRRRRHLAQYGLPQAGRGQRAAAAKIAETAAVRAAGRSGQRLAVHPRSSSSRQACCTFKGWREAK
ncbi:sigma 54-interacting transcriptional regulator [Cupriavidus basilensis]